MSQVFNNAYSIVLSFNSLERIEEEIKKLKDGPQVARVHVVC